MQKRFCTHFRPFSRGKSAFEQVNHPLQLQAHIVPNQLSKVQKLVFHEIVQKFVLPDLALRSWLGAGEGFDFVREALDIGFGGTFGLFRFGGAKAAERKCSMTKRETPHGEMKTLHVTFANAPCPKQNAA